MLKFLRGFLRLVLLEDGSGTLRRCARFAERTWRENYFRVKEKTYDELHSALYGSDWSANGILSEFNDLLGSCDGDPLTETAVADRDLSEAEALELIRYIQEKFPNEERRRARSSR